MDNKKIMPRRLYEAALGFAENMEPASDYKDSAANWSRALCLAADSMGCVNVLDEMGMPDGFACPRSFYAWWDEIDIETIPEESLALEALHTGLKYADADLDPQWYDMGNAAMCAMAEYPPWLAWKESRDEDDIEFRGDRVRLDLAKTTEFEKFLVDWVRTRGKGV